MENQKIDPKYQPDIKPEIPDVGQKFWERHKNPWSGITRYIVFFGLMFAIWYHSWLWILISIIALLTNPFWFPPPKETDHWMTRAVIGETIWLARSKAAEKITICGFGFILAIAMVWALNANHFWTSIILGAASTAYKTAFLAHTAKLAKIQAN